MRASRLVHRPFGSFSVGALVGLSALALAGSACKAGFTSSSNDGTGAAGANASNSTGTHNNTDTTGAFSTGSEMTTASGIGGSCAGVSKKAEKTPLDLWIMMDQSGSMSDDTGNGTKWSLVTNALKDFVQDPTAAGLGVGIQYFGLPPGGMGTCPSTCMTTADCGACGPCMGAQPMYNFPGFCVNQDSCNWADYATADKEIDLLPGAAQGIIQSLGAHSPNTGTPTSAALQGAINHAKGWAHNNPGHVVVVVFATDGDPSSCDTDIGHIDDIAAKGFTVAPSIRTFVIGVGSSLDNLNSIAAAGGTGQAFIVDTTMDTKQQFLDALHQIQGIVLPCAYKIPVPDNGTPDFHSVNVRYTPGGSTTPQIIPNVIDKAHCPATGDAWYYDDNNAPTQILLCPNTCNTVSGDINGQVDVVLGCSTIPA